MLKLRQKYPEEVFTPRSAEVNPTMYINRPELEASLGRAIRTGYHVVIYGDSGCGKSWLYKKVFKDQNIFYSTLDFSGAITGDDVDLQILELVSEFDEWKEKGKEASGGGQFTPGGVGLKGDLKRTWEKVEQSPLAQLLEEMRREAGRKKTFLVLENIEHILDKPEVVGKVQNMLLALDDPKLGKHKVRLCLVGVPAEIKEVLTAGNKYQTISNRVVEIPEVDRLSKEGVGMLVQRGLEQQLDFTIVSKPYCTSQISFISDRVPQYVHDICLHTALVAEDNLLKVTPDVVEIAFDNWVESNARQSYEFICDCLEKKGPVSDANARVVFAVARCEHRRFRAAEIEGLVRENFPRSTGGKRLQVLRMLRQLSSGEDRLLKCDDAKHNFRLATPKLRSVLRATLKLDGEVVSIKRL